MKKGADKNTLLTYTLFLLGIVFLVESVVFAFVLSQLPAAMLGTTITIAWIYALIKFVAGIVATYAGLVYLEKK
jgi:hypothetical protein